MFGEGLPLGFSTGKIEVRKRRWVEMAVLGIKYKLHLVPSCFDLR
jgi:hypothetical protein